MRRTFLYGTMALLAFVAGQAAFAQAGLKNLPPGKWWTTRWVIAELGLRPNQQNRIEALWKRSRMRLAEQKAELDNRQQALAAILGQEFIDEQAALEAFDAVARARHVLERSTFLMRVQIKNHLSVAQQQKLEGIALRLNERRPVKKSGF